MMKEYHGGVTYYRNFVLAFCHSTKKAANLLKKKQKDATQL
jgi:hypothetical protein